VAAILDAAKRILATEGALAVTFRRVSREANLSTGTIGYYFSDRAQMLEACLDDHHAQADDELRRLQEKVAAGASLRDVIEEGVLTAYRTLREDREALRLRRITALERGELDPSRRAGSLRPMLQVFAQLGKQEVQGSDQRARLVAQSIIFTVTRYALLNDAEACELTGKSDVAAAYDAIENHLVDLVRWIWEGAKGSASKV
jgi:AcrR family transcriptional regulator